MFNSMTTIDQAGWQARAALLELLALSFRHPTPELAEALHSGEWKAAADELALANAIELPASWDRINPSSDESGIGYESAEALLHALRTEATRLFVGAPDPLVSPYEGVWRAAADGVQPLLFVNPSSLEVEKFCRSCGLGHPEGTNEPLDHIATELELLEYLASLAAGIVAPHSDAPSAVEFPGGSPEAAFYLFANEHLLSWASEFAKRVQHETRLPLYRAATTLLNATARKHQ